MNKSERLMNERMTFVSRRGRTAESQRTMWLQKIRAERQGNGSKFYVVVNGWATYEARTIRQGKILGLSIVNELAGRHLAMRGCSSLTVEIFDKVTMIRLWETER